MTHQDNHFYLPQAFSSEPVEYPQGDDLIHNNPNFPQLCSKTFMHVVYNYSKEPRKFLPCYSLLDVNSEGTFVIGTNNFTSPIVNGNFIITEDFESIVQGDASKTSFQLPKYHAVTALKFLESEMFLAANMDCTMEVFSTKKGIRDQSNHVYRISELETEGFVQNVDKLTGESKFIVGTDTGCLSIFDFGSAEVICSSEIPFAHESAITGVSSHPSSQRILTSSAGINCLVWDKSQELPATKLLTHWNELTAVHWCSQEENKELVVLGDEVGNVLTVDLRAPNKLLNSTKVSKREISGLFFNGSNNFGAISTNSVTIVETSSGNVSSKVVKTHSADQILYSMCWDRQDKSKFFVVGDQKTALKLSL